MADVIVRVFFNVDYCILIISLLVIAVILIFVPADFVLWGLCHGHSHLIVIFVFCTFLIVIFIRTDIENTELVMSVA